MKLFTVLRRKCKKKCGFTLVETLITMLILLMVTAVVAGGVPSAANAYYKVIDAANAQILLYDTIMKLRSELEVVTEVNLKDDTSKEVVSYVSGKPNYDDSGWLKELKNTPNGIVIERSSKEGAHGDGEQFLVQGKLSGGIRNKTALITRFDSIKYENGVFTIENLRVEKDGKPLADLVKIGNLEIRNVTP